MIYWLQFGYVLGALLTAWHTAKTVEASFWGVIAVLLVGVLWPVYVATNLMFWAFGELFAAAQGR